MPNVTPPCGPIVGWDDGPVTRFTGIPYARAQRFREPERADDWTRPLHATSWAPPCPQAPAPLMDQVLGSSFDEAIPDEHCQNLSVTVPAGADADDALPVLVWLHGGSYVLGAGDVPVMDPAALVAEQRVIVVTVTYRLGVFGYAGGTPGRPANLGLLDQLAAFRWVRRNIAAFGGDPARVTAFGQSAGGDAIVKLMSLPEAPDLFGRAIIQSAPLGIAGGRGRMDAAVAAIAARVPADAPVEEVVAAEQAIVRVGARFGLKGAMPVGNRYGRAPLVSEAEFDAALDATAGRIEVLIGHTSEEARLFVPALLKPLGAVGRAIAPALVRALTAVIYGRPSRRFARRHVRAGGRAHHYRISWAAPSNPWGSAHMIDLPLLFGDETAWSAAALVAGAGWPRLSHDGAQLRALWARFARGDDLGEGGELPGIVSYRRVG